MIPQGEFDQAIQTLTICQKDFGRLIEWAKTEYDNSLDKNYCSELEQDLERYQRYWDDCKANLEQLQYFKSLFAEKE